MMVDERALQALLDPLVPEEETVCEWDDVLVRVEQITKGDSSQRLFSPRGFAARRPRRAVRRLTVAFGGAVALAVLVFAAVAFWPASGGGGTLVQRALAAVGTGEVLHVVTEQPAPWYKAVSLPSGTPIQATLRREIWYDQSRDLNMTVTSLSGSIVSQFLETSQGDFSSYGPVGPDSQFPTNDRGPSPTLEPALAGFVDDYQSALAAGQATKTGTGEVDGHQVIWLHITAQPKDYIPAEDVAIDASTYAPILVRTDNANPVQFTVAQIDTQAYEPSLFTHPAGQYPPKTATAEATTPIAASQAPGLLGGQALWLGQTWNGYQLAKVEEQQLVYGYAPQSGKQPTRSVGVIFTYAPLGGSADSPGAFEIKEAPQCELYWGVNCISLSPTPTEGILVLGQGGPIPSNTMLDGLYVAIPGHSSQTDPVAVVNALQPLNVGTK